MRVLSGHPRPPTPLGRSANENGPPIQTARCIFWYPRSRMADYYSVISRAVAALEINTIEDRRAIYNRARAGDIIRSAFPDPNVSKPLTDAFSVHCWVR